MKKNNYTVALFFFFCLVFLFQSCSKEDNSNLIDEDPLIRNYIRNAESQLKFAVHCVDSASNVTANKEKNYVIPLSIDANGDLWLDSSLDWRSGFFPGCCWIMYELTNEEYWKETAIKFSWKIADATSFSQHDLGFMFNSSFGRAYRLTKDNSYKTVLLEAANTLSGRYNETIGCIQSWGSSVRWNFPVLIDAMMNMELLFEATKLTGDSLYWNMGISHANNTIKNHFRDDYSSYHVVSYYKETGEVQCKQTAQGYSDESYWSRGQSWGLYGFTMCYRYTKDKKYLDQACHIADFLMSLNYFGDYVPYWDMICPDIPNTSKDASAAAIMASALIELSHYVESGKSNTYLEFAKQQIKTLSEKYTCELGSNYGFILNSSVGSYPSNYQVDVPAIYADYYYLEAIERLKKY